MNVAVIRSKAEQALVDGFEAQAAGLPGGGWVRDLRQAALGRFARLGLPGRRTEAYKYTDLRERLKGIAPAATSAAASAPGPLPVRLDNYVQLVFVDGRFETAHGAEAAGHGRDFHFDPLAKLLDSGASPWLEAHLRSSLAAASALEALNTAYMSDGAVLRIAANAQIIVPIGLSFLATGGQAAMATVRNLIEIGEGARVTLVETHAGAGQGQATPAAGQHNAMTEMVLGAGAHVEHITLVRAGTAASHLGTCVVTLGDGAVYRGFQLTHGTALARHDITVFFKGRHASLDLSGLMLGRGLEHIDTTLTIDHAVSHGTSRELYKAVLEDRARAVFQGKVIVRPGAQKTDGKQMAKALMLSPDAEFDSKPELEIYADDVVCGHGSTAAELDENLLFYCQSRGIPLAEARRLLVGSFVGEAIEKIAHEGLRESIRAAAEQWLEGSVGGKSAP